MDIQVSAFEAETRLAALLERIAAGHSVTILRQGRPVALLLPAATPAPEEGRAGGG